MSGIPLGGQYYLMLAGGGAQPAYTYVANVSPRVAGFAMMTMIREGFPGVPDEVCCRACWWTEVAFPHLPMSGFEERRKRLRQEHLAARRVMP